MNATLLKALLGLVPASLLLAGSLTFFLKRRNQHWDISVDFFSSQFAQEFHL